ncbi:DUF418 domain-containing protein [Metabacillus arenae]|uniref:DUF418 domain-containing protein n=1 Tax=Metabacillus arenae TaxID=2771434 RepID=A0A926NJZ7_9BACI|nr:DUF418 domain-containing protein [Metabacillus arenae]MBD1381988.1 DUF418 domain-containing protein [Metabacillus arenae]
MMTQSMTTAPIPKQERVRELDIIRGFALLGILAANMSFFSTPGVYLLMTEVEWWNSPWDQLADKLIHFFATSKFFTMFSFLFGLGFVLFLQRAEQKVKRPKTLFLKRLFILLIIGLIHAFGIWYGDILIIYSITGLFLLLFYHLKPKTLLTWGFMSLFLPALLMFLASIGVLMAGGGSPEDTTGAAFADQMIEQSVTAYGSGTFAEIMSQRAQDYAFALTGYIFMVPTIFSMFLFGAYAAKTERYKNIQAQLPFYRKCWLAGLIIGLPFNSLAVYSITQVDSSSSIYLLTYFIGTAIGGPALCFFYMTSVVLLCQKKLWLKILTPLQAVGRLALSNYLLQSLVCTTIFYSYGFGLFGQVGPAMWLLIVVLLYSLQIGISHLWLKKFRFGPAEWLWRSLTYGKRQPFIEKNVTVSRNTDGNTKQF